jgi:hypothetical protein
MVINTYIIYESLEGLSCYNIIGGVGVPVSLRHIGLSVVRIRGSLLFPLHNSCFCVLVNADNMSKMNPVFAMIFYTNTITFTDA